MRLRNWTGFGNVVCVNLLDFWIPGEKTDKIEPDVARWEQNFFGKSGQVCEGRTCFVGNSAVFPCPSIGCRKD